MVDLILQSGYNYVSAVHTEGNCRNKVKVSFCVNQPSSNSPLHVSTPIWGKVESEVNKTCACVDRSDYFNLLSRARVESLTKVSESLQVMQK